MRRFKSVWKEEAAQYALRLWHVPEYRYFDIRFASKQEIANLAMSVFRNRINSGYRHLVDHPKSHKAVEEIRVNARIVASIGLYCLEQKADKI